MLINQIQEGYTLKLAQSSKQKWIFNKLKNSLKKNGNEEAALKILEKCCLYIKLYENKKVDNFIYQAIHNVKPLVELKTIRHYRGRTRSKPEIINSKRAYHLAILWIIQGAKQHVNVHTMGLRLYLELANAYKKKGYAIKRKEDYHNSCKTAFFQTSVKTK